MAAINVHIGTQSPEDRQHETCEIGHDGTLGARGARACTPSIERMHVGQTRMIWVRRALTDWMENVQYRIITRGPDLVFETSEPFKNTQFPWLHDRSEKQNTFVLIGEAGKMGCPTWDLPAGSPVLGGACPAATHGQSTVPVQIRRKNAKAVGAPVRLRETICQLCVAGDTLVLVQGKGWRSIESLPAGEDFVVWSGVQWRQTHKIHQGKQKCVDVVTSLGHRLRCTPDHKIATMRGMIPACELQLGIDCAASQVGAYHIEVQTGLRPPLQPDPPLVTFTFDAILPVADAHEVYDLVNVGPERQFVANGITVSNCYAEGSNYSTFTTQLVELLRYWWTIELLDNGRTEEWIETMVEAIQRAPFPVERGGLIDPRTGAPILPMRIHSSGDFFSQKYAEAWIAIVNRLPNITFWAPTRIWAAGEGWIKFWRESRDLIQHQNLIVRPSAYHTDDPAPSENGRMISCETGNDTADPRIEMRNESPWSRGSYPFTAAGTTAIYKFNDKNAQAERGADVIGQKGSIDPRYDWQCSAYAVIDDAKSCQNATGIDGKEGCRVCWLNPDKRINYTAH